MGRSVIPKGTRQETGKDRFIRKEKNKELVKDAKINSKTEIIKKKRK